MLIMGAKHSKRKKRNVRRLVPFLDVEVNIGMDDRCSISGITCLKGGRIVVADYLGKYVKYYDTKGLRLMDFMRMESEPYEVCSSPVAENEVFATLPFQQKILHLRTDEKIEVIKEIKTEGMCYGIGCFVGGLAVSLRIDKNVWQIEVLDFHGSVQKVFKDDVNGLSLFGFPDYIAMETDGSRLYVSDGIVNTVTAYNLKDSTVTTAEMIFKYSDRALKIPKGLSPDGMGNIFVVGCESNNVHKISRSGKKIGIVLNHKDQVAMPMGCCYDINERKVFITEGSRKVMIFKDDRKV